MKKNYLQDYVKKFINIIKGSILTNFGCLLANI